MKLNKNLINKFNSIQYNETCNKFLNCTISSLKRGDYVKLIFFSYDSKKKGGLISRVSKITALILRKSVKLNNIMLLVSAMYKNEKVKWRC